MAAPNRRGDITTVLKCRPIHAPSYIPILRAITNAILFLPPMITTTMKTSSRTRSTPRNPIRRQWKCIKKMSNENIKPKPNLNLNLSNCEMTSRGAESARCVVAVLAVLALFCGGVRRLSGFITRRRGQW
ncbi:hypothetical protein EX30DRAFT_342309 [Ascodesmis nigricans]|uniref:Uncharacterized protein n=1 Tax=Ascodesmis nigricans TaxID=341454 RepID=A0A4S2MSV4_9PEZI|nr:hypothetical protein EX30DRAFT_342309 [Ascodesmis nigricans]